MFYRRVNHYDGFPDGHYLHGSTDFALLQKFYHTVNIDELNNASEFPDGHSLHACFIT